MAWSVGQFRFVPVGAGCVVESFVVVVIRLFSGGLYDGGIVGGVTLDLHLEIVNMVFNLVQIVTRFLSLTCDNTLEVFFEGVVDQ